VAANDRFRTIVLECCLTKSIGRVRFSLDRLILASLVFALYIMHIGHWILVHCDSLQSYDKVNINIVVYITSTAAKCVKFIYSIIPYQSAFSRVPSHRKNHINFVLNHRLIKKVSINKSNYFHLVKVEQAINLWVFPLENESIISRYCIS